MLSLMIFLLTALVSYGLGFVRGEVAARAALKREMNAEPFPEPEPADIADEADEPEEEEDDVCLRPGTRVLCRLSGASHTHGVLRGFAMSTPDGPMLAVVDVGGGAPFMPIDVDLVEPAGDGPPVGYRDNAKPNEWN